MADRANKHPGTSALETRGPNGLNVIDVLTIIAVIAVLTGLFRVSLAKQGYTMAGPWNWMCNKATLVAQSTFGVGSSHEDAGMSPPSSQPVVERSRAMRVNAAIPITNHSYRRTLGKTAHRRNLVHEVSAPPGPELPWARSDDPEPTG